MQSLCSGLDGSRGPFAARNAQSSKGVGVARDAPVRGIETRLILLNEPLSGRTGIDEDHAHDLFGPALRVEPHLYAAQGVPNQHIRFRYGPGAKCRVQVVHDVGEDLETGRWIAEAKSSSVEGTDARLLRDHGLDLVPDRRPARATCHQDDRRAAGARAMQVNTPATDINPLTWLDVGQQPFVLRRGGPWFGLSEDNVINGKQRGGRQSRDSANCENGHDCSVPSQMRLSLSSNARDFRQAQMGSAIETN